MARYSWQVEGSSWEKDKHVSSERQADAHWLSRVVLTERSSDPVRVVLAIGAKKYARGEVPPDVASVARSSCWML